jgi:hypothetical protein
LVQVDSCILDILHRASPSLLVVVLQPQTNSRGALSIYPFGLVHD